jgi:hypothetical protein
LQFSLFNNSTTAATEDFDGIFFSNAFGTLKCARGAGKLSPFFFKAILALWFIGRSLESLFR